LLLTGRALALGGDGIIASGREVRALREQHGEGFLIVTPGIRPGGAPVRGDDQKRTVTPREAILNGADYLVVGRPIRDSADPLRAAREIQRDIAAALEEKHRGDPGGSEPRGSRPRDGISAAGPER